MKYFDSLASYPQLPEVTSGLQKAFAEHFANPSSAHQLGVRAHQEIERAREVIADSIGAFPSEIVFTSGATESNNLILKGVVLPHLKAGRTPHIITSAVEHKCILSICNDLEALGSQVTYLLPSEDGIVSCEQVQGALQDNTVLVSLMHVNNELGSITNLSDISEVCVASKVAMHTDAAQSFMKLNCDVDDLNVDFMSLSAHKIGGPKGIGAAYIRDLKKVDFMPLVHGAGQEFGIRGGTLATPLVIGFGIAVEKFNTHFSLEYCAALKSSLLKNLTSLGADYLPNGGNLTLDSCISLTLPNTDVEAILREHDSEFALSQGSACSSGAIEASHVLQALSIDRELASRTLRLSFSHEITVEDIERLASVIASHSANSYRKQAV